MSNRNMLGLATVVLAACASSGRGQTLNQKVANAWTFAASQVEATAANPALNAGGGDVLYPASTDSTYSSWATTDSTSQASGWDASFFPGELWLLYNHTGSATFLTDAEKWTYPLEYSLNGADANKGVVLDQDTGFQTDCTWGNALAILPSNATFITSGGSSGASAINTFCNNASYLATRFVADAGMIRSLGVPGSYASVVWPTYGTMSSAEVTSLHINNGTVIDHMMEMPCLLEPYALDPTGTFNGISTATMYSDAITDAVTSAAEFVRPDGSSYHAVWHYDDSDPNVAQRGQVWGKGTIQGYANESCWSRGQAWGMYGFTQTYIYTRNDATQISNGNSALFLTTAQNMTNYFWSNLPANLSHSAANYVAGDYVAPSDFDAATGEDTVGGMNGTTYYDAANLASTGGAFNQSVSGSNGTHGSYTNDRFTGLGTYTSRDTSASAVAADTMFYLAQYDPTASLRQQYFTEGCDILGSLLTESSTTGSGETDYFGENTSNAAIGVSLLLKASGSWDSAYSAEIFGDYFLLEAMTEYGDVEGQFVPEPASLTLVVFALGLLMRPRRRTHESIAAGTDA